MGRGVRGAGRAGHLRDREPLLPRGSGADRRIRRPDGGARPMTTGEFDHDSRRPRHRLRRRRHDGRTHRQCRRTRHAGRREVGAVRRIHRAVRRRHLGARCAVATQGGLRSRPRRRLRLSEDDHRRSRQRRPVAPLRRRSAGDDGVPREPQPMVRVRLEARLCGLLPGAARRLRAAAAPSTCPPSTCASSATKSRTCCTPLALAPKGIWFAPKDLRLFYQVRQNWRGKAVLLKLIWRMFRARVFGDRMAAIGQSLDGADAAGDEGARHPAVARVRR